MSSVRIELPLIEKSYYTSEEQPKVKAKLEEIYAKYKPIIDPIAKINNVEPKLVTSVIFIESRGDASAKNASAIGLMQLVANSCTDLITRQRKKKKLTESEKLLLLNAFGKERFDKIMKAEMGANLVTNDDLLKPSINILLGTMYLSELLDEETSSSGTIRLDRVITRYNKGYYNKPPQGDPKTMFASINQDSKNYVLKLGGRNGTLQLLT